MVGRDGELAVVSYLAKLTEHGSAAQPVVLIGLRGMGKTALLRRATRSLDANAIVLYAEGSPQQPLEVSFRRSLERATKRLESMPARLQSAVETFISRLPKASLELPHDMGAVSLEASKKETPVKAFADSIRDLNDAAHKHGRYLVLAVDEIQSASVADLLPLVEFVHESAGSEAPALFLGAGLPNSKAYLKEVKTYTERWRYLQLNLLDRGQAEAALALPAEALGVHYSESALRELAIETAGYPFFIQEFGSAAWAARDSNEITEKLIAIIVPGVRRLQESSLYEPMFDALTAPEMNYAITLAKLGPGKQHVSKIAAAIGLTVQSANWIRNQLVAKDVIYAPAKGLVEFRLPLTEQYIERHRDQLMRRVGLTGERFGDRERS